MSSPEEKARIKIDRFYESYKLYRNATIFLSGTAITLSSAVILGLARQELAISVTWKVPAEISLVSSIVLAVVAQLFHVAGSRRLVFSAEAVVGDEREKASTAWTISVKLFKWMHGTALAAGAALLVGVLLVGRGLVFQPAAAAAAPPSTSSP